eukprot:scaffold596306_cov33-Prasinocladus_malaysianus.AAC.1
MLLLPIQPAATGEASFSCCPEGNNEQSWRPSEHQATASAAPAGCHARSSAAAPLLHESNKALDIFETSGYN